MLKCAGLIPNLARLIANAFLALAAATALLCRPMLLLLLLLLLLPRRATITDAEDDGKLLRFLSELPSPSKIDELIMLVNLLLASFLNPSRRARVSPPDPPASNAAGPSLPRATGGRHVQNTATSQKPYSLLVN